MKKILFLFGNITVTLIVLLTVVIHLSANIITAQAKTEPLISQPNLAAAAIVVISTANSGAGTLRQAIIDANDGDTITFDTAVFPSANPATIAIIDTALPDINQSYLTIDASAAGVILDGSAQTTYGAIWINGSHNRIQGLQIINFPGDGIRLANDAQYNTVANNVIGNNSGSGIVIDGTNTMSNTITGNLIGLDPTGSYAMGNATGVSLVGDTKYNVVGGTTPAERNIISGNKGQDIADGVNLLGAYNTVIGNYIGTNISGTASVPNTGAGLTLSGSHNTIGGAAPGAGNLISGNPHGISVINAQYGSILGNHIGTDVSGTAVISNQIGINIWTDVHDIMIGGAAAGEGNLISGNGGAGISLSYATNITISGNIIGLDVNGTAVLPNGEAGIAIGDGAQQNLIGGASTAAGNLISGNGWDGVRIVGAATLSNTVSHNSIYANGGLGIELVNGGNGEPAEPTIDTADASVGTASGMACANCIVELFSDDVDEGRWFEGRTTANGSGVWSLDKGSTFTGPEITATATDTAGNTSEFVQFVGGERVYLPVVLKPAVPLTASPTLNPIDNADGDGSYIVSWSAVANATSYTLEEDDNAGFTSPTAVYTGANTQTTLTSQTVGTYYYRIKASNSLGSTGWSNTESASVTVMPPPCPQTGSWAGTTAQSLAISFAVTDTSGCRVDSLSIRYRATCTFGTVLRIEGLGGTAITNNHFAVSNVSGDFTTNTAANGTIIKSFTDPVAGFCSVSTTWTAAYTP